MKRSEMLVAGRTIRILQAVICILASLGVVAFTFYAERPSMTTLTVVTLSFALIVVLSIIAFIYAPHQPVIVYPQEDEE